MSEGPFGRRPLAWLSGVMTGVSSVSDLALLIDGPHCNFGRAMGHAGHGLGGTLLQPGRPGRILITDVQPKANPKVTFSLGRMTEIEEAMRGVARVAGCAAAVVTASDFATLAAPGLGALCRRMAGQLSYPFLYLPSRALECSGLEGYDQLLECLADGLELPAPEPRPDEVAVVGHFMDRTEGDQRGNVREIRRLLAGLGLEAPSVWLEGGPLAGLRQASRASAVVALPYGRAAAAALGRRLGVPVVEAPLPLGLSASADFVREVGRGLGRAARAEAFAEAELARVVPRVQEGIFRLLQGRLAVFEADPHAAAALVRTLDDFGMRAALPGDEPCIVLGARGDATAAELALLDGRNVRWEDFAGEAAPERGGPPGDDEVPDVRITPWVSDAPALLLAGQVTGAMAETGWIPFGYPCYARHAFTEQPFLGFEGVFWWVERLAEAAQLRDLRAVARARGQAAGGAAREQA